MGASTQGELRIESVISIENIKEFHMEIQNGYHSLIFLKGEISKEEGEKALLQKLDHENLQVWIKDEPVFVGVMQDVEIEHDGYGYQICIHGSSATSLIDSMKKSRTFQDITKTYEEIMWEVLADTQGAGLKFYVNDRKINTPVYQIEETDWEFIKRMASHLETFVVPGSLSKSPTVSIGLANGRVRETEQAGLVCEKVWFDKERRGVCRSIRGYENWNMGDRILWDGETYSIIEKRCQLEKGLLYFRYTIFDRKTFTVKKYDNPSFVGTMLPALVLDTRNEEVKVKFTIDKQQSKDSAYWYPWRPDGGNIMYCMPEIGETVYICLDGPEGERARAVCGVHKNGAGNPEMKVTDRYFTTADKKRMYLTPDTLGFKDLKQSSPLEIILNDSSGANVRSNRKLVVSAKDTVGIKGNNIFLQAPKEVSLVRRDSASPTVINMCNGFDSIGATNEVTASGSGDAGFPVFHESKQEAGKEYSLDGVEKSIIASTPGKGFTGKLERRIEGIRVDQVAGEDADYALDLQQRRMNR